ncbi:MAG: recombinase family protein [Candidatus Omnitrophica bacterium]|nr:recombinase family protein [Candidatus Omnitrophota bacterium]
MQEILKCAIYTRVSTDMQAEVEFNSCEAQEAKIKSFIKSQENMKIFRVYSDPGFTGANLNRPAFQELLQDVQDKKIDLVISYKIDRLTRSPKDFYHLIEIFDKHGVNFISVTERFDTSTPSGRLLRNIMLTFAQFERELISERTRDKMLQRAQKGMWNGGGVPFGYKAENKKLVIDTNNAKIVKDIYENYLLHNSIVKIYENLRDKKVTDEKGIPFSKSEIWQILRNATYTGKVKFAKKIYPGNHQAIISEEIFNLAQEIHKDRKRTMKVYKHFPLAGLIQCKDCGSVMTPCHTNKKKGKHRKRYYYYRCTKTFHNEWADCETKQVSANRLEDYIFSNLERISLDRQYLNSLFFSLNHTQPDGRIGLSDSSNNTKEIGLSGGQPGYEPSADPSKISPEIFAQTLAAFVKSSPFKKGVEKNLLAQKFIKSIIYSKESIEIDIFSPASTPLSTSLQPRKGFRPRGKKEKIPAEGGENSGNFSFSDKNGCASRMRPNYIIPIILPNTIHQCRKKNL